MPVEYGSLYVGVALDVPEGETQTKKAGYGAKEAGLVSIVEQIPIQ